MSYESTAGGLPVGLSPPRRGAVCRVGAPMREQVLLEVSAPARRGTARVAPGRRLAWAEWGPADGAPVLFSPGAATELLARGSPGGALERLGVRLIAVDRPGLGGSDPAPGRTLLDTGGGRPSARGGARARAAGDRRVLAGRAARARVRRGGRRLGGGGGLGDRRARRPGAARPAPAGGPDSSSRLAAADPPAVEALFRRWAAASLAEMIDANSPEVDLAVYREPAFAAALAAACAEGFVQESGRLRARRAPGDAALAVRSGGDPGARAALVRPARQQPPALPGPRSVARGPHPGRRAQIIEDGRLAPWTHGAEILAALLEARRAAGT